MSWPRAADLAQRLRRIEDMDRADCTDALAALPGVTTPPRLRVETLRRLLAHETQAQALGGLKASARRALKAHAKGRPVTAPTPGTQLVREWNGRTYRVAVTSEGYVLDGTLYRSLSAVAQRITGTAWSGPRFFGLAPKRSR